MGSHWIKAGAVLFGLLVIACAVISCGGGGSAHLRVVNASSDLGNVDILFDGNTVTGSTDIGYQNSTGYLSVSSGSVHLQIEPSGSSTAVVDTNVSIASSAYMTYIVYGYASSLKELAPLTDDQTATTNAKIRIINLAPSLGALDVYVLAPGQTLSNSTPTISNFGYGSVADYQSYSPNTYNVYFTATGVKSPRITVGTVTWATGQNRTMLALAANTYTVLNDLN